jgi:5-formyltetrahydrofolate cyclo-ligase
MAVPRLAHEQPFLLLDPERLDQPPRRAASIKGASAAGVHVALQDVPHIDVVVCGTVAVNRRGVRVGKGGGYSDLEFALLTESGVIDERTVVATTVHAVQVLDRALPETAHDFRVDLIVTPEEVIRCRRAHRPRGIVVSHLDADKAATIPVLAARA